MTVKELLANYEPRLVPEDVVDVDACKRCAFGGAGCYVRSARRACTIMLENYPEFDNPGSYERLYLVRKEERSFVGYVAVDWLGAFLYPLYPPVQNPVDNFWHPASEAVGLGRSSAVAVPKDFLGDKMPAEGEAPVRVTLTVKIE